MTSSPKNIILANRVQHITPSATLAITARAAELKKQGVDVISLAAGEPDFNPPEVFLEGLHHAITAKRFTYTPVSGIKELKDALITKFAAQGMEYEQKNISISCGAKHALFNICMSLFEVGDEVLIPKPYWVSYPEMVKLAGATPVFVEAVDYVVTAASIEQAITPKTKAVIINSPSNPSGAVIPRDELLNIAEVAKRHNLLIISDEIYEHIMYEGQHISIASLSEDALQRTLVVNGFSKSHAITGLRLGYVAGSAVYIGAINNLQSHSTSNPTSIVQYAALSCVTPPEAFLSQACIAYKKRRDIALAALERIPGVSCRKPEGAFYLFPKIPQQDDITCARELLEQAHVAVVPGSEFGMPGHLRISYATDEASLAIGLERLSAFFSAQNVQ